VPRLVVLTGGPGAGKTAALEVVSRAFCEHVVVLPEAASILFRGGFPRRDSLPARRAAQRAIFRVQTELERMVLEERRAAVVLCDRGTLDGVAYWPGDEAELLRDVGATREGELTRYAAVIHLRTPSESEGYNRDANPIRVETAAEAAAIDERIARAWRGHPRQVMVPSQTDFIAKLRAALERIHEQVPPCCRGGELLDLG
jgi:predicted ATPase